MFWIPSYLNKLPYTHSPPPKDFENTVKLDFKNRQDKKWLGFKNQITNDQLGQINFKNHQDKNNLTLRT